MAKTRELLKGCILVCILSSLQSFAMEEWEPVSAAEAGFSWDVGERLDRAFESGELENLHSVIVVRDRRLVFERYYRGYDRKTRSGPLGNVTFTPDTLHDLRSISKSIVSLLYGIALAEGKVPALETSLVDEFPAYDDLENDPDRRRITVAHALTMTMGLEWNEDLPYTDPRNSETAMDRSRDRIWYVLGRPIVADPGTTWNYTGGATEVLGHLISKGVGRSLLDYAKENLFGPLSITNIEWIEYSKGEVIAASGLRMTPRDLAKIGQLILNQGRWDGMQLVPSEWLASSFLERVSAYGPVKYGYHWWLPRQGYKWSDGLVGAQGNGGQRLAIFPYYQLVVVITAGNYNQPNQSALPRKVIQEFVLPALGGN
ncbi:MAG: serine hydrolase [Arenicellales bacterium]|nr:serine hydrolase [Arenicellales bacterium]